MDSIDLELWGDAAGHLIRILLGLAAIGGMLYLQWHEYRRHWTHGVAMYWIVKVAGPLIGGVIVAVTFVIASGISGMEALGVFYLGLAAALFGSPLIASFIARLLEIPPADSMRLGVSTLGLLLVAWFSGNMIMGAAMQFSGARDNYDSRRDYIEMQRAEEDAPPAQDEIEFISTGQWRLPDGNRFIHAAFKIQDDWTFRRAQVATPPRGRYWDPWAIVSATASTTSRASLPRARRSG